MLMSVCSLNDTATTDIYSYGHTLSLHDALPIFAARGARQDRHAEPLCPDLELPDRRGAEGVARDEHHAIILFLEQMRQFRSEEHTSELQSLMRLSYAVFCS